MVKMRCAGVEVAHNKCIEHKSFWTNREDQLYWSVNYFATEQIWSSVVKWDMSHIKKPNKVSNSLQASSNPLEILPKHQEGGLEA
jgi:hypothetical protein